MSTNGASASAHFVRDVLRLHSLRAGLMVAGFSVLSLTEGLAIALLVPLLSLVIGDGSAPTDRFGRAIEVVLNSVGLPLALPTVLGLFLAAVVAESLLRLWQRSFARRFLGDFAASVRVRLYEAYIDAEWPYWLRQRIGHMTGRLTSEATRVETAFYNFTWLVSESIFIVVLLAVAFLISWPLATVFTVGGAVLFLALRGRIRGSDRRGVEISDKINALQEAVQEHLNAAKFIKASNMNQRSLATVADLIHELSRAEVRGAIGVYRIGAVVNVLVAVLLGIGLYLAVQHLHVGPARILVVLLVFYRVAPKIAYVQQLSHGLALNAPAYTAMLADIHDARAEAERVAASAGRSSPRLERGVELDGVSYRYRQDVAVVSDISLEIPAATTVALVGQSGAGKSTVLDLILGLLQPCQGAIRVDGIDMRELDLAAWRSHLGYVGQETILFHDTIANNIRWTRPAATEDEVVEAARLANAHQFITAMPDRYATVVGHRGARLSGGERQRIALARALVGKPRLLILDEATSSLDAESERAVQDAIRSLRSRTTILMVAHRLATVRDAEWIHVLEEGRIVEQGTWDQLVSAGGRFAALWQLQSAAAVQGPRPAGAPLVALKQHG